MEMEMVTTGWEKQEMEMGMATIGFGIVNNIQW